jgi:hypothetical protein
LGSRKEYYLNKKEENGDEKSSFLKVVEVACLFVGVLVLVAFLSSTESAFTFVLVDANFTFFIGASLVTIGAYLTLDLGSHSDDAALGTIYQA